MGYGTVAGLGRVLYAPSIAKNLISVSQLTTDGFNISFNDGYCTVRSKNQINGLRIDARRCNGQYKCKIKVRNANDDINIRTMSQKESRESKIYESCYMMNYTGNNNDYSS